MSPSLRHRRRRGRSQPASRLLLAGMVLGVLAVLAGLSAVGYVVSVAASAPPLTTLKARDPGQSSSVYAANGQRLGFIQANELRVPVDGEKLPKSLRQATVAIEDERYYKHKGVDYTGVVRAAMKNVASRGETIQGGSTITMQLVRALYISDERTFERKIREAKLAEELENEHTKGWILDTYLNAVPYGTVGGQTALGAGAAARVYFNKRVEDLKLHESAMLAGLPQAPTAYSPVRSPEAAVRRRNEVLAKMAELGMIKPKTAARAMQRKLGLKPGKYFTRRREQFVFDYVKDALIKEYGPKQVKLGGLRVDTTIDPRKQEAARESISGRLAGVGPDAAIVTIDNKTGEIEAMASSADYEKLKYNLAAQGKRQPGSTFKIMTLMTAVRKGVDPRSTTYTSKPLKFKHPVWNDIEVKTYDGSYGGNMDLVRATLKSDNSVYMQLALDLGPKEVAKTAKAMGIRTKLDGFPSESLGGLTIGVSPLEMSVAYATIANGGYRLRPTVIKKITFPDGRSERPKRFRPKRIKAFEDWQTETVTDILQQNVKSGTGTAAQISCPAAGKTGTTDKHSDAWFVGFTPRLSTAVWVGYPKGQIFMRSEYHGGPVAGGTYPAEIWGDYMRKITSRGKCGSFRSASSPPQWSPFFGKYARSGAPNPSDPGFDSQPGGTGGAGTATYVPAPADQGATSSPTAGGGGNGGGGGGGDDDDDRGGRDDGGGGGRERPARAERNADADAGGGGNGGADEGGFNPDLYESPPQPGGAAAPAVP